MEKTYEVCPHCGNEVELDAELKVQTCPSCGMRIVTCSMCRASDEGNYCTNCALCCQARRENEELGKAPKTISVWEAEREVRILAEKEPIEDRVYELAQELAEKYTAEVENNHRIVDDDSGEEVSEDADGTMWYDEVREDAKKIIFEKIADFFTKKA